MNVIAIIYKLLSLVISNSLLIQVFRIYLVSNKEGLKEVLNSLYAFLMLRTCFETLKTRQ